MLDNHDKKEVGFLLNVLIGIALLMGVYLRVYNVLQTDFPLNDGGFFWTMTQDLIKNGFVLPRYTTYNLAQIPFAYPPGAFYVNGIIAHVFNIPLVALFRWMPLLFCILSLLLVYPIANIILNSSRMAVLTTFAFALIKPSYEWLLMGGGVTRSPAFFFSMLAVLFTLASTKAQHNHRMVLLSAISMTLTAYFHLEIAFMTALVLILLYTYYDHSQRLFLFLAYHLGFGLLLLSPYLIAIISYHGIQPLFNALSSSSRDFIGSLGLFFIPLYTAETVFPILAVFGMLGGIACFVNRTYLPLLWLILVTLINPRSVHRSAALPEAMLIAVGLETFFFHGLAGWMQKYKDNEPRNLSDLKKSYPIHTSHYPLFAASFILFYCFVLASLDLTQSQSANYLSVQEREAFAWVKENTDSSSTFMILPFDTFWEADAVSEWFPALTERRSILTVQGNEWVQNQYQVKIDSYNAVAECLMAESLCFETLRRKYSLHYDYILVPLQSEYYSPKNVVLQDILNGCSLVFQKPEVEIFKCAQN